MRTYVLCDVANRGNRALFDFWGPSLWDRRYRYTVYCCARIICYTMVVQTRLLALGVCAVAGNMLLASRGGDDVRAG